MNVKPISNNVLLKVKNDNSKIRLEGGQIILLDTSFNINQHSSVVCEVVEVPSKLIFSETNQNSMHWKTEMELRKGDEVIIFYMAYQNAFTSDKRCFIFEGEEYFFVRYDDIFVAKRHWTDTENDVFWKANPSGLEKEVMYRMNLVENNRKLSNVICLNGYILCQPLEKRIETTLIIPDYIKKQYDVKTMKAAYVGSPNREYLHNKVYYDDNSIEANDVIIVVRESDLPLEFVDHLSFYGKNEFFYLQRNQVHGIVKHTSNSEK